MKQLQINKIKYQWVLFFISSILLGDFLCDGNLNTVYHLLQFGHHWLFRSGIDSFIDVFSINKHLLFQLGVIIRSLNYVLILCVLVAYVIVLRFDKSIRQLYYHNFNRQNFFYQYTNSFYLHLDIFRANISLP